MKNMPDWDSFTPAFASGELTRLLAAAEAAVAGVEAGSGTGYEDFAWALDDAVRDLARTWGFVAHMLSVMNGEEWRKVEEAFQPRIVEFTLRVSQSPALYARAKAVRAALGDGAQPVRARVLDKMIRAAELAGVGLDGEAKTRFNEAQMRIAKLGADFANSLVDATAAFKYEKGGRTYTIDDANFMETMKHCDDREVRERHHVDSS